MTRGATLIWHRHPIDVPNRDWIRFLLGGVLEEEIIDLEGRICKPYSIVVEDTRSNTSRTFFEMIAHQRPTGLFHISDQYFSFDYRKYRFFDFVIKTHWSSVFEVDRLLVVPIGYESGEMPFQGHIVPASHRPLLWSFAGVLKASRYEMARALREVGPNKIYEAASRDKHLPRQQYVSLLKESTFAPCPMGNVIMESFRLYESLEAGCIPLVEMRPFLKYYEHLLGRSPLIFVSSWRDARRQIVELVSDQKRMDCLQKSIHGWWTRFKADLKEDVARHVEVGWVSDDRAKRGVRVKRVASVPGWHYAELLRHQSLDSLRWRISRNLLGGRLKVPY